MRLTPLPRKELSKTHTCKAREGARAAREHSLCRSRCLVRRWAGARGSLLRPPVVVSSKRVDSKQDITIPSAGGWLCQLFHAATPLLGKAFPPPQPMPEIEIGRAQPTRNAARALMSPLWTVRRVAFRIAWRLGSAAVLMSETTRAQVSALGSSV